MCGVPDSDLVARWREGDKGALDVLIHRHDSALESFLRGKANATNCLDLKQRVWEALIERPPREVRRTFRGYLFGTARNIMFHFYESEQRDLAWCERGIALDELETSLSQRMERRLGAQNLLIALRRLSSADQRILLMRYVDELSEAEMAEILDIPRGTVKSRLFSAKQKLRDAWPADGRRMP